MRHLGVPGHQNTLTRCSPGPSAHLRTCVLGKRLNIHAGRLSHEELQPRRGAHAIAMPLQDMKA